MVIAPNLCPPAAQPAAEAGPVEGCGFVKGVLFKPHQGLPQHLSNRSLLLPNLMSNPNFDLTMEEIQPIRTEADAVHQQTLLGMQPIELSPGSIYAIRTETGYKTIDLSDSNVLQHAGYKRQRPVSSYAFHTVESFVQYVRAVFGPQHAESTPDNPSGSEFFAAERKHAICIASQSSLAVRVVFDARPDQWGDITADLQLQKSSEAKRWEAASGKYMAQQDFAEFCELNLPSFNSPDAATILEIAQTFQAKTTVEFGSAVRLSNGTIKLKREEKTEATAGERADISIPEELRLAMPLFSLDKPYEVRARLRYRVVEGAVKLSVLLVDPEMAYEHAFRVVVEDCAQRLEMPVYWGSV
jgi:hypothetical protein